MERTLLTLETITHRCWWQLIKSGFYFSPHSLSPPLLNILPHFLEYQGSFQSCFHFGDSYRMEQTVGGVHIPGDSHAYTSHQHNGFHMSNSNTGSAGEDVVVVFLSWACVQES